MEELKQKFMVGQDAISTTKLCDLQQIQTSEMEALKKIVNESWKKKVTNNELHTLLEEHANNMRGILGTFDYEIAGIRNVVLHSKKLSKSDLKQYMRMVEGLTYAYKNMLGVDLASALLAGITLKAQDIHSLNKFYINMMDYIESKIRYYEGKGKSENRKIEQLNMEHAMIQSSMLRFFKRNRVATIKKKITHSRKRTHKLGQKAMDYRKTSETVRKLVGF